MSAGAGAAASGGAVAKGAGAAVEVAKKVAEWGYELGKMSVQAALEQEMRVRSFQSLTGSPTVGLRVAEQLRQLSASSGMGSDVYDPAKTLLQYGIGADELVKDLHQIGDIAKGDADRMKTLAKDYGHVRAIGKLMAEDRVEMSQMGFDPLQIMSERWEDFGYKQKMTVGQLKQLMDQGRISAMQVARAFDIATESGGKFHGVLEQMAGTGGGALQQLKVRRENFLTDIGNSITPYLQVGADVVEDMLQGMGIHKTTPDILRSEMTEAQTMVSSIVGRNEGDGTRAAMLDMLRSKYPQTYGGINSRTVTNKELLAMQGGVNEGYKDRIRQADYQDSKARYTQDQMAAIELANKLRSQAKYERGQGDVGLFDDRALKYLGGADRIKLRRMNVDFTNTFGVATPTAMEAAADNLMRRAGMDQERKTAMDEGLAEQRRVQLVSKWLDLNANPAARTAIWGANTTKKWPVFERSVKDILGKKGIDVLGQMSDIQQLLTPATMLAGNTPAGDKLARAVEGRTDAVTNGGERALHISIGNVVGRMENHVADGKDLVETIEPKLEEMMGRILAGVPTW
ncbi:hypothetical protein GCM10023093_17030 [Nemorincola caseinilytica]|uniref:Tape measure domain-containing protein n=1 Tax=Nemorincola caseinilytica TaxID=2054315 RepID=A0ABP8NGU9_9BACT